ncbi:YlbL family protein [Zafaria cholistanensis]|nr:S16 family serine protease [Zafaria cholistanensis]
MGATTAAVVLGFVALALPAPFVVESPGPAINTLGSVDGTAVIRVQGHETFPTSGSLDLTTVYVSGGPEREVSTFEVLQGWLDPSQDVLPEEAVYRRGVSGEQVSEQNTQEMADSQSVAVAAALGNLGIAYEQKLSVAGLAAPTNEGVLGVGDVLASIGGTPITDLAMLREELQAAGDAPVALGIERGGEPRTVEAATTAGEDGQRQLGVYLQTTYDFPFQVSFDLDNVGGPSAGMMFALGVVDTLTPGELTGGRHFAGTGTIDADGNVGAIGGIAQKMAGARSLGAEYFLAPAENCAAVAGRIPDGLTVLKVATLAEARAAVEGVAAGKDAASLPACP